MDTKRMGIALIIGTAVLYGAGELIFRVIFGDFYAANAGSATGVSREPRIIWARILGHAAYAALIIYTIYIRKRSLSLSKGGLIGGIVGSLMWCTVDFIFYSSLNLQNLTVTILDPMLEFIRGGIGGVAIAAALLMTPGPASGAGFASRKEAGVA